MADAADSKSAGGNLVPVQVRPPALSEAGCRLTTEGREAAAFFVDSRTNAYSRLQKKQAAAHKGAPAGERTPVLL